MGEDQVVHNGIIMPERTVSLLRLLTNSYIDRDVARLLLEEEPIDSLLDIQTVMVVGMSGMESGEEEPCSDPAGEYEKLRAIIPLIGDHQDEVEWMLQPEYKQYLQMGMLMLSLQEKGEQYV